MKTARVFSLILALGALAPALGTAQGRGADYGERGDADKRGEARGGYERGGHERGGHERGSYERSDTRGGYERGESERAHVRGGGESRVAPAEARQGGFAPQHGRSGRADDNPRRLERIAGFDGGHRSQDQGWDQGYSGHERSWGRDYRHEAYREGWQDGRGHQRIQHRQEHYRRDEWRHPEWRSHWHHGWGGHRYRAPVRYVYPRGYGRLEWRIGFSLPSVFLLDRYYVDHHYYRIAPPPYGCRWLRVDGDLLLVELATGFVVEALYDFFYW